MELTNGVAKRLFCVATFTEARFNCLDGGFTRPVGFDVVAKAFEVGMDFLLQWGQVFTWAFQFT